MSNAPNKAMKPLLIAASILVLLVASNGSSQAESIAVAGTERNYLLDGAGPGSKSLIIALHGAGGSAAGFRRRSGLLEAARAEGFSVVWPDSADGNWNDGRVNRRGQLVTDVDDEAFLLALVKDLVARKITAPNRIFITGHSNGGMMSFFMGCKHSKLFKAMAPVSANIPRPMDCKGQDAIAVLNIVGLEDRVVPNDGGGIFGRKRRGELMSVRQGFDVMMKRNGCRGDISTDTQDASITRGESCKAPTELLQIKDQGHAWPNDAAKLIVGFFRER
jgi:polyhydroxybutyrate depolymerase